ncbi:MAG UNVERIFIED_CONTAM: pseudouridine synthase [Rickettsiaceae bacterium]|jgi:23S rRNA pseudouridine955/2504/2580 synthase
MKGDRIDYKITDHDIPIRLDRYLRLLNPKLTQGVIEKSLREKRITVNKQKAKSNSRITNGDIVSIDSSLQDIYCEEKIDEVIQNDNGSLAPKARPRSRDDKVAIAPRKLADKLLKEYLLYDHPKFYAFNKPAGLASQGGSKISLALDDAFKVLGLRLVHRLDKETSGIILAAKTRDSAIILTGAFAKHKIYKTYLAIVSPSLKKRKVELCLIYQNFLLTNLNL